MSGHAPGSSVTAGPAGAWAPGIADTDVLLPSWPAPAQVQALFTTRRGGVSSGPWGDARGRDGLNLGVNCGDAPAQVALNRRLLEARVGLPIRWLVQVHGTRVIEVDATTGCEPAVAEKPADAQMTSASGIALAVLVADCLPVLLTDRAGSIVAIAHAGWRGLAGGVLENTVASMRRRRPEADLLAWLGPSIGSAAFEVGRDVLDVFIGQDAQAGEFFRPTGTSGKWWADLAGLATRRLQSLGITAITRADACTVSHGDDFWSYRRDPVCGRMAGVIWLQR